MYKRQELHGSTLRNYCTKCGRKYGPEIFDVTEGIPKCSCGGTVRPDVVLYGENLDMNTVSSAVEYIRSADMPVSYTHLDVYKRQVLYLQCQIKD